MTLRQAFGSVHNTPHGQNREQAHVVVHGTRRVSRWKGQRLPCGVCCGTKLRVEAKCPQKRSSNRSIVVRCQRRDVSSLTPGREIVDWVHQNFAPHTTRPLPCCRYYFSHISHETKCPQFRHGDVPEKGLEENRVQRR